MKTSVAIKKKSVFRLVFASFTMLSTILIPSCSGGGTASEDSVSKKMADSLAADSITALSDNLIRKPQGNPYADYDARVTKGGFVYMGAGDSLRIFTTFKAGPELTRPYIKLMSDFHSAMPDVRLYAMVVPSQAAYYVPDKIAESSQSFKPAYDYLESHLDSAVNYVDIYNILAGHTKEDIYLRTDHHWSPLGAYYAAQGLAEKAGVPFKDLSDYDEHVVHGYVGSMYHYTKSEDLKSHPEDFIYWTPKDPREKTTYINYSTDPDQPLREGAPYPGEFFHHFPDGSAGAYCTFMGGDHFLVKVETGVPGGRRLLIIKDSLGNPIPAYLFNSFEEIHIVDHRFFNRNLKKYVQDNKITDLTVAISIYTASAPGFMQNIGNFLTLNPSSRNSIKKSSK